MISQQVHDCQINSWKRPSNSPHKDGDGMDHNVIDYRVSPPFVSEVFATRGDAIALAKGRRPPEKPKKGKVRSVSHETPTEEADTQAG